MTAARRSGAGTTLVELMIALTIGLFLIAGAFQLYLHSRATLRSNESVARLQEQARYAFAVIVPDIRMAGYLGPGGRAGPIDGAATPAEPRSALSPRGDCGQNWTVDLDRAIAASNGAWDLACAPYGAAAASADTLTIRRAASEAGNPDAAALYVMGTRGKRPILFAGPDLPAGFMPGISQVHELVVNAYYVSRNSSLDAPGRAVPSLRRKFLRNGGSGPAIADEEVLPGVEDLQIELGIDLDPPGAPEHGAVNRYVDPDAPDHDPHARVLAVRIWLRMRAEEPEPGLPAGPGFDYADQMVPPLADGYRRLLVSRTVFLRNAR